MAIGIDDPREHEVLNFKPDLEYHPGKIITASILVEEAERLQEATDEIEREDTQATFVEGLIEIDTVFSDISAVIADQQSRLLLEINPQQLPQLAEAITVLSNGRTEKIIDFELYNLSYDILAQKLKGVYTADPRQIPQDIDHLKARREQLDKIQADRLLEIAVRRIGAQIIRRLANIVPSFPPLSELKRQMELLADKLGRIPVSLSQFNLKDPLAPANAFPETAALSDYIPFEQLPFAKRIMDHVRSRALSNTLNSEVNPAAFLEHPMVERARLQHEEKKALVSLGLSVEWRGNDRLLLAQKNLDDSRWGALAPDWLGDGWQRLRASASQADRLEPQSRSLDNLTEYGNSILFDLLRDILRDLRYWYESPRTLCCLLKWLSISGKADLAFLRALQIGIRFRLGKIQLDLQAIVDESVSILNDVIQIITVQLIACLDTAITGKLEGLARRMIGKVDVTGCSPFDELTRDVFYYFSVMKNDLLSHLAQYLGQIRVHDVELRRRHILITEKARLDFILRVLDEVITVLATLENCEDDPASAVVRDSTQIRHMTLSRIPGVAVPNTHALLEFAVETLGMTEDQARRALDLPEEHLKAVDLRPEVTDISEKHDDDDCGGEPTESKISEITDLLRSLAQRGD